MKKLIEKLKHKAKTIELNTIKELAFEYVDEDWKSKEQIIEEHEEIIAEIESIDPQDEENKIWDNWYARWKEVAYNEILAEIEKSFDKI